MNAENERTCSHLGGSDKMKGYGKLRVGGTCVATDLEIYGDLIIDGYL